MDFFNKFSKKTKDLKKSNQAIKKQDNTTKNELVDNHNINFNFLEKYFYLISLVLGVILVVLIIVLVIGITSNWTFIL